MRKNLILFLVGAVAALAISVPLFLKEQAEARRLAVERDRLAATLDATEKRAFEATDRLDRQAGELERLRRGQEELLKLRGEITRFRQASTGAAATARRLAAAPKAVPPLPPAPPVAVPPEPPAPEPFGIGVFMPSDQCHFAGFGTPENVLETLQWALRSGRTDILEQAFLPVEVPAGEPSVIVGGADTLAMPDEALPDGTVDATGQVQTEVVELPQISGITVIGGGGGRSQRSPTGRA